MSKKRQIDVQFNVQINVNGQVKTVGQFLKINKQMNKDLNRFLNVLTSFIKSPFTYDLYMRLYFFWHNDQDKIVLKVTGRRILEIPTSLRVGPSRYKDVHTCSTSVTPRIQICRLLLNTPGCRLSPIGRTFLWSYTIPGKITTYSLLKFVIYIVSPIRSNTTSVFGV